MGWTDLVIHREKKERAPKAPKAPKITIYKDGVAKVTPSVLAYLGQETIHVLHNTDNAKLIAISREGQYPHKLGKQGTFSAASLWRLAGCPQDPIHVDLSDDPESGYLIGDLDVALESAQTQREARATLAESEGESAPGVSTAGGEVDPSAKADLSGPSASGPSDTSHDDEDDDDDEDEDPYDEESEDSAVTKVAAQY